MKIDARIKFLVDFLDLPGPKTRVNQLSGGQQRRVSLAVALLHSPEVCDSRPSMLKLIQDYTKNIKPVIL